MNEQPSQDQVRETLQTVQAVAVSAGLELANAADGHLVIQYELDNNRRQYVHVLYGGALNDMPVVALFSCAAEVAGVVPSELLGELLQANGRHLLGYWGFYVIDGRVFLAIAHNMPLESLTPDVFRAVTTTLAWEADQREQKMSEEDHF